MIRTRQHRHWWFVRILKSSFEASEVSYSMSGTTISEILTKHYHTYSKALLWNCFETFVHKPPPTLKKTCRFFANIQSVLNFDWVQRRNMFTMGPLISIFASTMSGILIKHPQRMQSIVLVMQDNASLSNVVYVWTYAFF